jgi:hypothetical protein
LHSTTSSELLLAILVLLTVGVMTATAPAFDALKAQYSQGIVQRAQIDQIRLVFRAAPGRVGDGEFAVDVADLRPGAQQAAAQVLLRLSMADMDMGMQQIELATQDGRRYSARGSYLSMAGRWRVEVILRRAGFDDARHTFEFATLGAEAP